MIIEPIENPDPIKITNMQGEEIFRITPTGDIYWKGRFIEGDDDLRSAVKEMVEKMTPVDNKELERLREIEWMYNDLCK